MKKPGTHRARAGLWTRDQDGDHQPRHHGVGPGQNRSATAPRTCAGYCEPSKAPSARFLAMTCAALSMSRGGSTPWPGKLPNAGRVRLPVREAGCVSKSPQEHTKGQVVAAARLAPRTGAAHLVHAGAGHPNDRPARRRVDHADRGRLADHPADRGGTTYAGLTAPALATVKTVDGRLVYDFDGDGDVDAADVRALAAMPEPQRTALVVRFYEGAWSQVSQMPWPASLLAFDGAVHSGPRVGISLLQRRWRAASRCPWSLTGSWAAPPSRRPGWQTLAPARRLLRAARRVHARHLQAPARPARVPDGLAGTRVDVARRRVRSVRGDGMRVKNFLAGLALVAGLAPLVLLLAGWGTVPEGSDRPRDGAARRADRRPSRLRHPHLEGGRLRSGQGDRADRPGRSQPVRGAGAHRASVELRLGRVPDHHRQGRGRVNVLAFPGPKRRVTRFPGRRRSAICGSAPSSR